MTDTNEGKPAVKRIDGRLHLIREVADESGDIEHRVAMPPGVEDQPQVLEKIHSSLAWTSDAGPGCDSSAERRPGVAERSRCG